MEVNTNKLPMLVNQTRYITKASLVFSHLREKTDWISFVAEDWFVAASCLSSSATFTIQHFTTSDTHSLTFYTLKKHLESVAVPNKQTNFSIQKSCQNEAWLVRPPKYLPLPLIIEGRQKRLAAARGNWLNENYLKFWVYTWSVFSSWLEIGVFQMVCSKWLSFVYFNS